MLNLKTSLIWPGCAQGKYIVKAKGFFLAELRWGNQNGPLPDWSPIAYLPIDPAGNGEFFFPGRRAIPRGATHVWARCVSHDFSTFETISVRIPERFLPEDTPLLDSEHFSLLTDLHLATKPWMIRRALRDAESETILLLGDSTNDGRTEQFSKFLECIEMEAEEKLIFSTPGNHDILNPKESGKNDGSRNYTAFQQALLERASEKGVSIARDSESLAYAVRLGGLDLIGLPCVISGRKFLFPEGRPLDWLEAHLQEQTDADWHVILCHAPMLAHNPNRSTGAPYLDKNKRLQALLDQTGRIIFLSGHTHVSPNVLKGGGEFDEAHRNVYLDCGSVVATDISGEEGPMASDWKDGCITELSVSKNEIEICMRSINSEVKFPRGYYRFSFQEKET